MESELQNHMVTSHPKKKGIMIPLETINDLVGIMIPFFPFQSIKIMIFLSNFLQIFQFSQILFFFLFSFFFLASLLLLLHRISMDSVNTGRELLATETISTDVVTSFSILVFLILLGLAIAVAYVLERTKFKYVHETFLSIVIGKDIAPLLFAFKSW